MSDSKKTSRRDVLKKGTASAVAVPLVSTIASKAYAQGSGKIKIALVGCGGRGRGAASQALSTASADIQLTAMADAFPWQMEAAHEVLSKSFSNNPEKVNVPPDKRFIGVDAFKQAIDSGVDGVILTTPPGFRPITFEYAVKAGKNVFMEKPVATDAPGVRRILAANKIAKEKGLKVGVGLQRHHQAPYLETIKRIKEGAIGDPVTFRCYWNGGGVWTRTRADMANKLGRQPTEMEYQMWNWYYFNWMCGDHINEQHIHNIDVCNWVMMELTDGEIMHPIAATGMGGREVRTSNEHGEIFDHHAVEFWYRNDKHDVRMFSFCRHIGNCWNSVSEFLHGTKGEANISGASIDARSSGGERWRYRGDRPDPYQVEHDDLWRAVAGNETFNEADYGAASTMTAILGRMATYSGAGMSKLRYDTALERGKAIFPADDMLGFDKEAPVKRNGDGSYPVPVPGSYEPFAIG